MLQTVLLTPAQLLSAAEGSLRSYTLIYGQEILDLTPEQALELARGYREEGLKLSPPISLPMLCKSIHYQSIATSLDTIRTYRK